MLITQLLSQSDSLLNRQAQQWLKREKQEEEQLLLEVQQEHKSLQRRDVLGEYEKSRSQNVICPKPIKYVRYSFLFADAMKILVEEECQRERKYREYEHSRNEMTRSLLSK